MIGNPKCPTCGLYELNDGSEDTLYTCECDEDNLHCDECAKEIFDDETFYSSPGGKVLCKACCPGVEIGERQ